MDKNNEVNKNTEYIKNYNKENYSRVSLYFTKEQKEVLQNYCDERNLTLNEFIKGLIDAKIGDLFDDAQAQKEIIPVKIYYTVASTLLFVCGNRWLHVYPPENGYRFRINLCSHNAPWLLSDFFREQQPDEKHFNRWIKTFTRCDSLSSKGEDFSDVPTLMGKLFDGRTDAPHWLIYDGSGKEELTFPEQYDD